MARGAHAHRAVRHAYTIACVLSLNAKSFSTFQVYTGLRGYVERRNMNNEYYYVAYFALSRRSVAQ